MKILVKQQLGSSYMLLFTKQQISLTTFRHFCVCARSLLETNDMLEQSKVDHVIRLCLVLQVQTSKAARQEATQLSAELGEISANLQSTTQQLAAEKSKGKDIMLR